MAKNLDQLTNCTFYNNDNAMNDELCFKKRQTLSVHI